MTVLTSYEGSFDDIANCGTNVKVGQSFQLASNSLVSGLDFYGGKGTVGTQPGTFAWEIVSGSIDGTVIATTLATSSAGYPAWNVAPAWHHLDFIAPILLMAGVTYFLRLNCLTGSTNDVMRWAWDNTSPSYALGSLWSTPPNTQYTTHDTNFRIIGEVSVGTSIKSQALTLLNVG